MLTWRPFCGLIKQKHYHKKKGYGNSMAVRKETFDDDDRNINPKKRSRITIEVSPELRRKIRIIAATRDISISEYLVSILERIVSDEAISIDEVTPVQEEQPLPDDFLEQVHQIRRQVVKESKGEPFEDSTELVRKMREDRTRYLLGEE